MSGGAWKARLAEVIAASGKSNRQITLSAGLGPGYLTGVFKEAKEPALDSFFALCDAIPADPVWILFGIDANEDDLAIVRALQADPEKRGAILALIRSAASRG